MKHPEGLRVNHVVIHAACEPARRRVGGAGVDSRARVPSSAGTTLAGQRHGWHWQRRSSTGTRMTRKTVPRRENLRRPTAAGCAADGADRGRRPSRRRGRMSEATSARSCSRCPRPVSRVASPTPPARQRPARMPAVERRTAARDVATASSADRRHPDAPRTRTPHTAYRSSVSDRSPARRVPDHGPPGCDVVVRRVRAGQP